MSCIDFQALGRYEDIPEKAVSILSKPERCLILNLNLLVEGDQLLEAPCYVVYHNTCRGPAKGGIRLSANVTLEETRFLAELMTWKTALAGIPFGGGKSAIACRPESLNQFQRTAVIKEFVHMIRSELDHGAYIPAPDLGTGPRDMAIIYGETHLLECVTGKPPSVGGLPGRREATGCGVAHAARLAAGDILGSDLEGLRVCVQGFGNVGSWTCRFLADSGARLMAVSDVNGGVFDSHGLNVAELCEHVARAGTVVGFPGDSITNEDLLGMSCDILVPAAVENVLTAQTAATVNARLVVEAANGPTTPDGDAVLNQEGIPVVPDIFANSGGVIASYVEWRKAKSGSLTSAAETYGVIHERMDDAFRKMLDVARERDVTLRMAAQIVAVRETTNSMRDRAWI